MIPRYQQAPIPPIPEARVVVWEYQHAEGCELISCALNDYPCGGSNEIVVDSERPLPIIAAMFDTEDGDVQYLLAWPDKTVWYGVEHLRFPP